MIPFLILIVFKSFWWILAYVSVFYIIYGIEWLKSFIWHLILSVKIGNKLSIKEINTLAYNSSMFEMEAKENEGNKDYLSIRTKYNFLKYFGKV